MTKTRVLFACTALFMVAFVFIIASADAQRMPAFIQALYAFPGGDKVGHVALMGMLSLLINATIAVRSRTSTPRRMVVATLVVTLVVAAEELSQLFFPNRTMAWDDLACSLIGIWVVGFGGVMMVFVMALENFIRDYQDRQLFDKINKAFEVAPPDKAERSQLRQMRRQQRRMSEGEW